ncbi:hypothetical protein HLA91_08720, partial [Brevibacterium luteolum]|nr:hypothetical protein [Brevibacterium luteolum]
MSHQYQPNSSGSSDPYGYGSPEAGGYSGAPTPYSSPAAGDPYAHQPAGAGYGSDTYAGTGYGSDTYGSSGYGTPQSYGQPGYVQTPPQNTLALLSLIMSLVGLATSGLTAIVGIILDRPGSGGGFDLTERIGTCPHRVSTLQKSVTVLCVWSTRSWPA